MGSIPTQVAKCHAHIEDPTPDPKLSTPHVNEGTVRPARAINNTSTSAQRGLNPHGGRTISGCIPSQEISMPDQKTDDDNARDPVNATGRMAKSPSVGGKPSGNSQTFRTEADDNNDHRKTFPVTTIRR